MDFLKDILGTELFEQVANAVNAYNGNEANKDKQIKIANLASGKYVDKGKYTALEELLNKKDSDLTDAQKLIDYSRVIELVVADLCTTPVALSAPPAYYGVARPLHTVKLVHTLR